MADNYWIFFMVPLFFQNFDLASLDLLFILLVKWNSGLMIVLDIVMLRVGPGEIFV